MKGRRIDQRDVLSFLDLEKGTWRDIPFEPWRAIGYATWEADGRLLALGTAADASRWIVRVDETTIERIAPAPSTMEDDDFRVSPDGKTAAIITSHLVQTHWWIPRSPD